jgi:hypothetical protein
MGELTKVVVHFTDGTVRKGTTQDFNPNQPKFHLQPRAGGPAQEVQCRNLKAVFFVSDYSGNPSRQDIKGFLAGPGETAQGKKIAVLFSDGELLCGYSLGYSREREGFFMFPADKGGNNNRIFVMAHATAEIKAGPAADVLAEKILSGLRAPAGPAKGMRRRVASG